MKASLARRPGAWSYSKICGIATGVVMLCAAAVSAASYARITLKQLTERSRAVVEVQVLGNSYPVMGPGETFPRTHVDLKILRTLKGSLGDRFMLDTPGGINGDVISYVPDAPDFKIDEHAIVFIKEPDAGHFMVQDLGLGKYNIVERDGKKFVESPICAKAVGVNTPIEKQEDLEANLLTRSIPYALFCGMVENYAVGMKPSQDPAKLAAMLPPSNSHVQNPNGIAPEAQSKIAALKEIKLAEAAAADSFRAKLGLGGVVLVSALLAAFIVYRRKNAKATSGKAVAMVMGGALLTGAILGGAGARAFVTFEQRTIWNLDRPIVGKVADNKILFKQSSAVSKSNANSFTGVLNSFNKWANVTGSRLGFASGGATDKKVNDSTDQENTMAWTSTPSNDFSQNTLGITFSSFTTGAGSIFIDGDIIFNDRDFDWSANGDGNPDSVSLHEIGHFIGLNHTTDKGTVMFPFDGGLTQLTTDEKNAAQALYPGATQASPPPAAPPPTTPPPAKLIPPTSVADASPKAGPPGTTVSFTSTGSVAADITRPITKFDWQFGDGTSATGPEVTHTYTTIGTFVATLFVTDVSGAFSASMVTINIGSGSDTLKANFKLIFAVRGKDSFSATVDIFDMLGGKPIAGGTGIVDGWLNIGDQPWKFTFDARKGKSLNLGGISMALNTKKGLLTLSTKNSDLRDVLGGHGAVNDNVSGVDVTVPVSVWFKDQGYVFTRIPFIYNAKLDKAGTGKF